MSFASFALAGGRSSAAPNGPVREGGYETPQRSCWMGGKQDDNPTKRSPERELKRLLRRFPSRLRGCGNLELLPERRAGVPDRIRTCGPQIRNLVLYPSELRGRSGLGVSLSSYPKMTTAFTIQISDLRR